MADYPPMGQGKRLFDNNKTIYDMDPFAMMNSPGAQEARKMGQVHQRAMKPKGHRPNEDLE